MKLDFRLHTISSSFDKKETHATIRCSQPQTKRYPRSTDRDGSDLDLMVDALPGATLFDLGGLQDELESLLGVLVDLLTPADLPPKVRAKVFAEAQPV